MLKIDKRESMKIEYIEKIKQGAIFIYPTDTIYGIGCDATNKRAVARIRKIKGRGDKPFSVIAPSKKWISDNCFIKEEYGRFLNKLPGRYTLIINLKKKGAIAKNVVSGETIGVRIPKHWFSDIVKKIGRPIITTSVNKSGERVMTCTEDVDKRILKSVDFVIYGGRKSGKPSTIIDLTGEKAKIIRR
jgi:tRNA threonylcarbamoyl adenosine modification protein (Sua5/YciO/YrdC/YwlC family)